MKCLTHKLELYQSFVIESRLYAQRVLVSDEFE
jgi:hypothetical protein